MARGKGVPHAERAACVRCWAVPGAYRVYCRTELLNDAGLVRPVVSHPE